MSRRSLRDDHTMVAQRNLDIIKGLAQGAKRHDLDPTAALALVARDLNEEVGLDTLEIALGEVVLARMVTVQKQTRRAPLRPCDRDLIEVCNGFAPNASFPLNKLQSYAVTWSRPLPQYQVWGTRIPMSLSTFNDVLRVRGCEPAKPCDVVFCIALGLIHRTSSVLATGDTMSEDRTNTGVLFDGSGGVSWSKDHVVPVYDESHRQVLVRKIAN